MVRRFRLFQNSSGELKKFEGTIFQKAVLGRGISCFSIPS